ncbi:CST complex subunit CTC1-like isoform X2 [Zingiber officinale]|uniref:CST complex subunit CTC1-like isoform X2 n=1 Tax=Zingiber officinale TaxID=94328 RepID=UPI001C4A8E04|nr:CST complex subunit CTC1-like isoform X2 [Zingiber officinale]
MERIPIISISDLVKLGRPLTGAASLCLAPSASPPPKKPKCDISDEVTVKIPLFADHCENSNPGTFSPLSRPVIIVGTVELFPRDAKISLGCLNHCFSFSDGSSRVCCYFLDFDLRIIGCKVKILAWNFLPLKHGDRGVLEVIRWSFTDFEAAFVSDSLLSMTSACSSREANMKCRGGAFGILKAVSSIFRVPCTKQKEDNLRNSGRNLMSRGDLTGFLVEILTCVCDVCNESSFVAERDDHHLKNKDCHSFSNSVFVYFMQPNFLWRPALYRLIGKSITISRLKRNLIFVGNEVSYEMFVSTPSTMVSLTNHSANCIYEESLKKSDEGMYNGVVTGIYMQGMVIELDDKVLLLIPDPPQHSLRMGAIVSVRNFHFIHVKYSWVKIILLGTCVKTCISVKSFSMTDIRSHSKSEGSSILERFLESLTYSAKLWMLLLVSCFKKKFGGIFSYKDILGSKKKEGFAQTYATTLLPPSAFETKSGLFTNFCKHGRCSYQMENLSFLKLVIPISNLKSWCEVSWISLLAQKHNDNNQFGESPYFEQLYHREPLGNDMIRRIFSSDDMSFVLVGMLKVSPYSGRLQLTDATGSIDAVVPDLPLDVNFQAVYEVKDYKLVIEGSSKKIYMQQQYLDEPLSCRTIFQHFSPRASSQLVVYVHFYLKKSTCMHFFQFSTYMDNSDSLKCNSGEMFHLLYVTHKFPAYHSLHEDVSLSNSSEIFLTNLDKKSDCIDNFLRENYRSSQIPCLLVLSRSNSQSFQFPFYLHCARGFKDNGMLHNHSDSKILLEFSSNNLDKYQMLRVGSYYLLKCSGKGLDCKSKACKHITQVKPLVISESIIWRLSILFDEAKHQNGQSQHVCSCVSSVRNDKCLTENFCQPGQTFLHLNDETHGLSDVHLHMYSEAINQLEELESLLKSFHSIFPSLDKITTVSSCIQQMMAQAALTSGILIPANELPQGNLLSLSGNIESISIYDFKPKCACSSFTVCEHWSTCEVCMLVNDDCHTVRIRGSISRYAYPIGLGHAVNATFHKVLLTQNSSQTKELMLTPMSFIVVNTVKEICPLVNVEGLIQESRRNIPYEVFINTKSSSRLISNVLQCTDSDLIHLNCRVVCIITLVLENQTHGPVMSQPVGYPKITTASIPLLGFLVEDGSSSLCYCWADNGRAEIFLRLHESSQMIFSSGKIVRGPEKKYSQRTTEYLLYEMLKKHKRIIVRNHGAAPDLSCVDLSFSIDSDQVFSNAEEKLLRSITNNTCHAPTLSIAGITMNSTSAFDGRMEFLEHRQALQSLPYLWVKEVVPIDSRQEAYGRTYTLSGRMRQEAGDVHLSI